MSPVLPFLSLCLSPRYLPLWVWRECAFPCAPFTIPSFIKKIITQLSPGGLAHADWLFKLLPLYWSSVWKDSNRFILPKAKCFVLDEFLRAECKRWHEKEAFLGWNYAWTMVVVWKIVAVKVLGHWWSGSDQLCLFWTAHNWQTFGGKEGPPAL